MYVGLFKERKKRENARTHTRACARAHTHTHTHTQRKGRACWRKRGIQKRAIRQSCDTLMILFLTHFFSFLTILFLTPLILPFLLRFISPLSRTKRYSVFLARNFLPTSPIFFYFSIARLSCITLPINNCHIMYSRNYWWKREQEQYIVSVKINLVEKYLCSAKLLSPNPISREEGN